MHEKVWAFRKEDAFGCKNSHSMREGIRTALRLACHSEVIRGRLGLSAMHAPISHDGCYYCASKGCLRSTGNGGASRVQQLQKYCSNGESSMLTILRFSRVHVDLNSMYAAEAYHA